MLLYLLLIENPKSKIPFTNLVVLTSATSIQLLIIQQQDKANNDKGLKKKKYLIERIQKKKKLMSNQSFVY